MTPPEDAQEINQLCKHVTNPFTETLIGFCAVGSTFAVLNTGLAAYDIYRFNQEVVYAEEQLDTAETEEIEVDGRIFGLPDTEGYLEDYLENQAGQTRNDKLESALGWGGITASSLTLLGVLVYIRKRELDPNFNLFKD